MPERTCVGCREKAEKSVLTRIVFSGGRYCLDARQREQGRGAYLHPACVERAWRTRGVQRALKRSAAPSPQLQEVLDALAAARLA